MLYSRLVLVAFGLTMLAIFGESNTFNAFSNSRCAACPLNSVCRNINGFSRCVCNTGYYGNDINPSYCNIDGNTVYNNLNTLDTLTCLNCFPYGRCTVGRNGFSRCICRSGYRRSNSRCVRRSRVNPCYRGTHSCHRYARCIPDSYGLGYECRCKYNEGYYGSGRNCRYEARRGGRGGRGGGGRGGRGNRYYF